MPLHPTRKPLRSPSASGGVAPHVERHANLHDTAVQLQKKIVDFQHAKDTAAPVERVILDSQIKTHRKRLADLIHEIRKHEKKYSLTPLQHDY